MNHKACLICRVVLFFLRKEYPKMKPIKNNLEVLLLRKVAEVSQKEVAEAIGRDTSTTSRIFSGKTGVHIDEMEDFFTALGLKVIECDGEIVTLTKKRFEALRELARDGLEDCM